MECFKKLGLIEPIIKSIDEQRFTEPSEIQMEAIPLVLEGRDIVAGSATGSGKTLVFGSGIIQNCSKGSGIQALVLTPTRELAEQVAESLRGFSRYKPLKVVSVYGGVAIGPQFRDLKTADVVVGTPGRILDHISRRSINLTRVKILVFDEADRMLDMGFVPDIKKIIKSIPEHRQTMLFSATMPKEIEAIARQLMANPTRIEVDRSGTTPAEVSHEMFLLKNKDKSRLLALQLQECTGPVLVFTRTKHMARKLTVKVKSMGFSSGEIHSNRSLAQRKNALEGFKRGRFQVLIATDIAARGIDVKEIELVVNYDMPANSED
ncbi:DEAD/DEAH box helicase, partial [Candidatus Babeliales bacterium]|nr:DEAD/DEAH box helicase [Candidatus Babeliales bacterium]